MSRLSKKNKIVYLLLEEIIQQIILTITLTMMLTNEKKRKKGRQPEHKERYGMIERIPHQIKHLSRMVAIGDDDCINNLRMDRNTFAQLFFLMRELGGLVDAKYVTIEEQVAMFFCILAHHKKNKIVKFDFWRSGQTVSHYIHLVLKAILKLHAPFLVNPELVPDDCTNPRWKWFKVCLGALDGTYINVKVRAKDKARHRTSKGQVSTNVLVVCDRDMRFIYVLPSWEGSAVDSRVLRNAVNRVHGLKVPTGNYYLCDNGYANSEGFLAPYKSVRYHVNEWGLGSASPQTVKELFNMRHTRARNVIERAFGVMKIRWGIFRSATYYPIKVHIRLIMCSFLLYNFIRSHMPVDPFEQLLDAMPLNEEDNEPVDDVVDTIEPSPEWNLWRDEIAQNMWDEWI